MNKVPQLTLPPTGTSPNWYFPQLALLSTGNSPNCRYTKKSPFPGSFIFNYSACYQLLPLEGNKIEFGSIPTNKVVADQNLVVTLLISAEK